MNCSFVASYSTTLVSSGDKGTRLSARQPKECDSTLSTGNTSSSYILTVPRRPGRTIQHQIQWVKAVPLQAWSGPEGSRKLRFPDYMTMAQDGGKVVSLTHRPPLPPGNAPGTHLCQRLSRPQGHSTIGRIMSMEKNPMTPSGIEPATFRFVAQYLNHCAVPLIQWVSKVNR
jgi:hypothetical protein